MFGLLPPLAIAFGWGKAVDKIYIYSFNIWNNERTEKWAGRAGLGCSPLDVVLNLVETMFGNACSGYCTPCAAVLGGKSCR